LFLRKFESRSKFENEESEFKEIIPWISEKSIEEITTILHNLQEEIFISYKCAVEGYFKYLQLAYGTNKVNDGLSFASRLIIILCFTNNFFNNLHRTFIINSLKNPI
jgi:hypothetical protein